ncbi:hypothetical protein ABN763_18005 [Spongiivirga sp. MCCC 1A20706]|uniref:hypothetical protein n=1 Tax=Spongiivirga sp. MCCC 1A20706 TaxID=3160963 RepID=UPI00397772DE
MEKKKILFTALLCALMLVKVSALHAYFHADNCDDSIENCIACDLAIESQQAQFIDIDVINDDVVPKFNFPSEEDHLVPLVLIIENNPSYYHQNRPPPVR